MTNEHDLASKIARAKQLLAEIHHVPLATVSDDGTPLNSPLFMAFDTQLHGYWSSSPECMHSRNIARDGKVFMALFDSRDGHGGLYIEATAKVLETPQAIAPAYERMRALKQQFYGSMGALEDYLGAAPQRLYCATPVRLWVNKSERNEQGVIIADRRYLIKPEDLQ
jgi:general stress protein 26